MGCVGKRYASEGRRAHNANWCMNMQHHVVTFTPKLARSITTLHEKHTTLKKKYRCRYRMTQTQEWMTPEQWKIHLNQENTTKQVDRKIEPGTYSNWCYNVTKRLASWNRRVTGLWGEEHRVGDHGQKSKHAYLCLWVSGKQHTLQGSRILGTHEMWVGEGSCQHRMNAPAHESLRAHQIPNTPRETFGPHRSIRSSLWQASLCTHEEDRRELPSLALV